MPAKRLARSRARPSGQPRSIPRIVTAKSASPHPTVSTARSEKKARTRTVSSRVATMAPSPPRVTRTPPKEKRAIRACICSCKPLWPGKKSCARMSSSSRFILAQEAPVSAARMISLENQGERKFTSTKRGQERREAISKKARLETGERRAKVPWQKRPGEKPKSASWHCQALRRSQACG